MSNLVKGRDVVIKMFSVDNYYPVFCAKNVEFLITQDEIEITNIVSGSSREYEPGMMSATLSISGVTTLNNTDGKISITFLMQQAIRRATQLFTMTLTNTSGTDLVISFSGILVSEGLSREVNGFSQSSLGVRVTGNIAFDEIVLPPVPEEVFSIYVDESNGLTAGTNSIQKNVLIGATIIQVARSGSTHKETGGTPGNHQFLFVSGTGTVSFDSTNPFNVGEWVYVEYKT